MACLKLLLFKLTQILASNVSTTYPVDLILSSGNFEISSKGSLFIDYISYSNGVRPAISLKSGIDFLSGTGTAENPYVIE